MLTNVYINLFLNTVAEIDPIFGANMWKILLNLLLIVVACILFIVGTYLKEKVVSIWKRKKLTPKKLRSDVVRDNKIYSILGQMEEKFHCDRAFVFLLHNGGAFGNGIDMKKMSCVYEVTRLGIEPTIQKCQSLLLTGMPAAVQTIIESNEKPFHVKVKDIKQSHFKQMLVRHGVELFVIRALHQGDRIIGFIGVDYCWEYDQNIQDISLNEYALQCESLLSGN